MKKGSIKTGRGRRRGGKPPQAPAKSTWKKPAAGAPHTLRRKAIFFQPGVPPPESRLIAIPETLRDLPFSYNQTKLVILVRDPFWAFGYWDFSADTWRWAEAMLRRDTGARPKLRVHNLDRGIFYDLDVDLEAKNWYLHLGLPDTTFEVELGLLDSQGKFHLIAKSSRFRMPRDRPSDVVDPNWRLSREEFDEIYRLSGGRRAGASSGLFSRMKRPSSKSE